MKEIAGFWWPDDDKDCNGAVFGEVNKIDILHEKYLNETRVCVQAGGNVGVFPRKLAETFGAVYTFEPHPENFTCLARNCPQSNIIKFQAALGSNHEHITVGVSAPQLKNNCGAYQVTGVGITPTMMIDDLELPVCDLIYLDIEGYELFALQGGYETIKKFHPVIVIENKQLPLMYDVEPEQVIDFLIFEFGYEVKERIARDVILT